MIKHFFTYFPLNDNKESSKETKSTKNLAYISPTEIEPAIKSMADIQSTLPVVEPVPNNEGSPDLMLGSFKDWATATPADAYLLEPTQPIGEELPVTDTVAIPNDEQILRQVGENMLKQKLVASELTIKRIATYLQDNQVTATVEEPKEGQYFFYEDLYYSLTSSVHTQAVYDIACNLNNTATLNHFLKKRPDVFTPWREVIKKHNLFENTPYVILNSIAPDVIVTLITKTLSSLYTERLAEAPQWSCQFKFNATAQAMGKTILEYFISQAINKLKIPIKDIKDMNNPFENLYKLFSGIKYDRGNFMDIFKLKFQSHKGDLELAITSYFCRFLIRNDLITFTNANKDRTVLKLLLQDFSYSYKPHTLLLGSFILEALISIDLLKKSIINEILPNKTHVNIPVILMTHETYTQCMASATFFKPTLAPAQKQPLAVFTADKMHITIKLPTSKTASSYDTRLRLKPLLDTSYNETTNTPMCVNKVMATKMFNLLHHAITHTYDKQNNFCVMFLSIMFEKDIATILANTSQLSLVEDMLRAGLYFIQPPFKVYKTIYEQVKKNPVSLDLFYKIYSSIPLLVGCFNEINLYQHFRFFYIPKYLTSTGRLFSRPYFFNLQNFKLMRSFINFYDKSSVTAPQYLAIAHIMREIIPNQGSNQIPSLTYKQYLVATQENFNGFIQSFLSQPLNISTFPVQKELDEQLQFMSFYVKKKKDLLYVTSLLSEGTPPMNMIYQKDATTSGPALISLIMQNQALAFKANVLGDKYFDLYSSVSNSFIEEVLSVRTHLDTFCQLVFTTDFDRWLNNIPATLLKETYDITKLRDIQEWITVIMVAQDHNKVKELILLFTKHVTSFDGLSQEYNMLTKVLVYPILSKLSWLYKAEYLALPTTFLPPIQSVFTILRKIFQFYIACKQVPLEALRSRLLFKKSIMTYFYNAGEKTRVTSYNDYFTAFFVSKGLNPPSKTRLNRLCVYLNMYFEFKIPSTLPGGSIFISKCSKFITNHTRTYKSNMIPVTIDLPYLSWDFMKLKPDHQKRTRRYVPLSLSNRFKHRFVITRNSTEYDVPEMIRTFASIFTQSIDALVVHKLFDMIYLINARLNAEGLPLCYGFSNHDAYGINIIFSIYLAPIIASIYNDISTLRLNKVLDIPTVNTPPIIVSNPFFIKH